MTGTDSATVDSIKVIDSTFKIPCQFGGPDHEYPADWRLGGASGRHPGADARFEPTTYQYFDSEYARSFLASHLLCDDEALDFFTRVCGHDPDVKFVGVKRPGENKYSLLGFIYVPATDTVHPLAVSS